MGPIPSNRGDLQGLVTTPDFLSIVDSDTGIFVKFCVNFFSKQGWFQDMHMQRRFTFVSLGSSHAQQAQLFSHHQSAGSDPGTKCFR